MASAEHDDRAALLASAAAFCEAFRAGPQDADGLLHHHFTRARADAILVREHGLPRLAPFLGRDFRGADGLREYLSLVSACLAFDEGGMRFGEYVVDPEARKVSVRGRARLAWKSTGQAWDEVFTYVLAFDRDHRVERYEIWADTGAAWLASRGELAA
ncbi:hypothetical protein VTH06DRAFT_3563 [Thermothelomyces fergusii]